MKARISIIGVALAILLAIALAMGVAAAPKKLTASGLRLTPKEDHAKGTRLDLRLMETPAAQRLSGKQGGEDIATAVVIPDLGWGGTYTATGTTVGYLDDYDESCPSSATLPDVVYSYTPVLDQSVNILLCESSYMTKLFVYENDASTLLDCNTFGDPYCTGSPPRSALANLFFTGGETYYIVIDGYMGQTGDYQIDMEASQPVTRMNSHPSLGDANNNNMLLAWDYVGPDDTVVYWVGSEDNGETFNETALYWTSPISHPHIDYFGGDTSFFAAAWTGTAEGWFICYASHPMNTDDWYAYSMTWPASKYHDCISMDMAADDFLADSVDAAGLPWLYGIAAMVETRTPSGAPELLNEPFIAYATDADGGTISWYGLCDQDDLAYQSSSTTADVDKISHFTIQAADLWHADSAAWGLFLRQDVLYDFDDTLDSYGDIYFFRDELPTLESIRRPAVARHDDNIVVLCEYYTDDGRAVSDNDIICLRFVPNQDDATFDHVGTTAIAETDGDEVRPEIVHIEDQHYACIFYRNDSIFRAETQNAGANWSAPCLVYGLGEAADPDEFVHVEDVPVYDLADFGNQMAWHYRDYDHTDSSTYIHYGSAICSDPGCCIDPIRGDVKMDGLPGELGIDVSDIVYLVNWMFKEGPDPTCEDEADVASSGGGPPDTEISIPDLVFLVNFMFKQGPQPPACP